MADWRNYRVEHEVTIRRVVEVRSTSASGAFDTVRDSWDDPDIVRFRVIDVRPADG
jgi:hypothetical protein